MAHLKKRKSDKWTAEIRQPNHKYISKTFLKKSNASNWAREKIINDNFFPCALTCK